MGIDAGFELSHARRNRRWQTDSLYHPQKLEDPEVQDLPLFTEVIKGEDNLATYKTWAASYEFQRPFSLPPNAPKERLDILRKAFAATLRDPEFLAEAKKTKLDVDPVAGEEIDGYVKQIYSMSEKVKQNLSFLVRSTQTKSNQCESI